METGVLDVGIRLLAVLGLVLANGFFVAAEFAIISVRKTRIDQLLAEGSRMARPVRRALDNPDQISPPHSSASRWPASASDGSASRRLRG